MSYLDNLFGLEGKIAIIIGGTGELCGYMAQGMAEAGAHIILVGRNPDKATARVAKIEAAGGTVEFISADIRTQTGIQNIFDSVIQTHGKADILVNGAGINSPTPILDITAEEIQNILNVNLVATLQASQIFARHNLEMGNKASIINLGSISGLNPLSRVFSYSASKAAVHNLSRNMAREWAEQGIRVNTLVPGFFPAEQNKKVLDASRVTSILEKTPANRFGSPEELIGATLLLASDSAGGFITGHELVVDGGFNAMSI